MNTKQKIQTIILKEKQVRAKDLREKLGVSQVLIHRHLKALVEEGIIQKVGSVPRVFYIPKKTNFMKKLLYSEIIEENFLEILPNGQFLYGTEGFLYWCNQRKLTISDQVKAYGKIFREQNSRKNHGLIDATAKITQAFSQNFLEKIWYLDFYSWEILGRTKLGKLILYAKQNSDQTLMKQIAREIKSPLKNLIARGKFTEIGLIPHSVPRKKDFLKTTLDFLDLHPKPKKYFAKIFIEYPVAQKTLKSKSDREKNANETLFLQKNQIPRKVLLIDDACGSGATLNIAAQKIKKTSPKTKIYALAFVGSLKGFEVIQET
jgi:phosphoribosylpyrophosphate synthetase